MVLSFSGVAGFSPLGWPTGENPARRRGFRGWSGDRFRERHDLGEKYDEDHELQVRHDVEQRLFHDDLLEKERGDRSPWGEKSPQGVKELLLT